ncbi:response regulator [Granulicella tundricola]|uniref:Response regulator receiver protein n=1 Tax=Granulicella tundricola (strain ATCC BAA-1859 / DSM 23138 / MP5ACTX9) TaxID=1198114 RepID=E8X3V8_GRATM|nr:response regulator [Granulicella tundricola]ADW69386.1 response regulator receiver protein [Granulicella tundricola MP5ACTX9]
MRVLIVDDSAVMRKVVERALRQSGLPITAVLQANDGQQALDLLREPTQEPLDLILTDINMPGLGGLDFLEQRNQQSLAPGTPVVMITTEGSEALVHRAIAAGAKGYICKPFTAEQIRARVCPLLPTCTTPTAA